MFTKDIDKTLQKMTGRTITKVLYGIWNKGYFDRFDEFSSAKKESTPKVA